MENISDICKNLKKLLSIADKTLDDFEIAIQNFKKERNYQNISEAQKNFTDKIIITKEQLVNTMSFYTMLLIGTRFENQDDKQKYLSEGIKIDQHGHITVSRSIDMRPTTGKVIPNIDWAIPPDLEINGDLDLRAMKIKKLPRKLKINGHLNILGTPISELPSDLEVSGNITASNTPITMLPEGLYIGGDLILQSTPLLMLPDRIKIGGSLNIRGCPGQSIIVKTLLKDTAQIKIDGDLHIDPNFLNDDDTKKLTDRGIIKGKIYN